MRIGVAAFLLVLLLTPSAHAKETLTLKLEALAKWCTDNKLFGARQEVYRALLVLDPDHAGARKGLRFKRKKNGEWYRRKPLKPGRDFTAAKRREFDKGRLELAASTTKRVLAQSFQESEVIDTILFLDPHQPVLRAARGERRVGHQWYLNESVTARQRRRHLVALADTCLREAPRPESIGVAPMDNDLGIRWVASFRSGTHRILSAAPRSESMQLSRLAESSRDFFGRALGIHLPVPKGRQYYVLMDRRSFRHVIANHPALDPKERKSSMDLGAKGIGGGDVVFYSRYPSGRREWVARNVVNQHLRSMFKIKMKHGWIVEGVGLYMTHRLTGRHTTWFVQDTKYAGAGDNKDQFIWKELRTPGTDWLELARALEIRGKKPDLPFLVSKGVNVMKGEDLVWSYALASYLMESYPDHMSMLLTRIGEGTDQGAAFKKTLEYDLMTIERRLMRWVHEAR